jgi:hypothetical protein
MGTGGAPARTGPHLGAHLHGGARVIRRDVLTGCVYDGSSRHAHRVTHVRKDQVILHLMVSEP